MNSIQDDIIHAPITKTLIKLASPMMVAFGFQTSFNFIDRYFVSLLGDLATAAVGMAFIMQLIIIAIGAGIGMGLNSFISRNIGAKRIETATQAALISFLIAIAFGILILIIGLPLHRYLFRLLGAEGKLLEYISNYLTIILIFSPVSLLAMSCNNIFRGWGNTVDPMKFMIMGTILNILLDPILIFGLGILPGYGIKGAALATGLSRTVALIYTLVVLFFKKKPIMLKFTHLKFSWTTIKGIFQVGFPSSIGQFVTSLTLFLIFLILKNFGDEAKTAYTIAFTYEMIIILPILGIGQAISIMVGHNYGAKQFSRIKTTYFNGILLSVTITILFSLIILSSPEFFASVFARSTESIAITTEALRVLSIGYAFSGIFLCTISIFLGLGLGTHHLIATLMKLFVFILPLSLIGSKIWSIIGVWIGILGANLATATLMMLWLRNLYFKKLIKGKIVTL